MNARHPTAIAVLLLAACATDTSSPVATEDTLRTELRDALVSQAAWTRLAIVSIQADLPDTAAATARLLATADDVGGAFRPLEGDAFADDLTALLQERDTSALRVVAARRDGRSADAAEALDTWSENVDALAALFGQRGRGWDETAMRRVFRADLEATMVELTARERGDYATDLRAYDQLRAASYVTADACAHALATRFPDAVSASTKSLEERTLRLELRALLDERAAYQRLVVVERLADLPSSGATEERLFVSQDDLGRAIGAFYDEPVGAQLTRLLRTDAAAMGAVVDARRSGDAIALARAEADWDRNAEDLVALFAGASPHFGRAALDGAVMTLRDQTSAEIAARAAGRWADDVTAADAATAQSRTLADTLAGGIDAAVRHAHEPG